jgi:hypothetical protein
MKGGDSECASTDVAVQPQPLAAGMALFRSIPGRRVETLLQDQPESKPVSRLARVTCVILVASLSIATITVAPRAMANPRRPVSQRLAASLGETRLREDIPTPAPDEKEPPMKQQITTLAVLAALTLPAGADDEKSSEKKQPPRPPITKKTPDEFPEGMQRFNGMLVGRLAKKDVEKGTFVINVDVVPRVWRNSKAEDPKSIVGKNVEVDGVFGKWLDVLLLVKEGETLECEARHDGGNKLTFPGELLRKAAPYKAEDYPILPEAFRGFNGSVAARIVRKDTEMLEMIIEVDRVIDTWKGNKAKKPESIKGK